MQTDLKILIVERSPLSSPTIREMLGKSKVGTYINEASGYSDALYQLKQVAYDMLVYDICLPERLRLSLLRYMRTRYPHTKLIPFCKEQKAGSPISSQQNLD